MRCFTVKNKTVENNHFLLDHMHARTHTDALYGSNWLHSSGVTCVFQRKCQHKQRTSWASLRHSDSHEHVLVPPWGRDNSGADAQRCNYIARKKRRKENSPYTLKRKTSRYREANVQWRLRSSAVTSDLHDSYRLTHRWPASSARDHTDEHMKYVLNGKVCNHSNKF